MTTDDLVESIQPLAGDVVADPRWNNDTLEVVVLGMILYGYALSIGRMTMFLDVEDIDEAVVQTIMKVVGAARKWTEGMVAEANQSAFDEAYHPGNFELIGVGQSYFGEDDVKALVDNVFANIESVRERS